MFETRIMTASGTTYVVTPEGDGYAVTRVSGTPVLGYDEAIFRQPMTEWGIPLPGYAWHFRTAAGPFTTTAVVSIDTPVLPIGRTV